MVKVLFFLLLVVSPLLLWSQNVFNTSPLSTGTAAGLEILLSPSHPIHVESGDDPPRDFTSTSDVSTGTTVYNSCHYRIYGIFLC